VINAPQLLVDLTRQLKGLEADLRQRIAEQPRLNDSLRAEWQAALDAKRCAETFETWADQVITQAGVHWLLNCVFLRFIEDHQLVDRPWLAGTPASGRLALARDRHEAYFRAHPLQSDRDYLLAAFREAGTLPGLHTFFDEAHNPIFRLGISGDAAMALRQFWQQVDTDTGLLLRDFTDQAWNTRFLGDLYQDLSEATRKRYALLQTPEFVEEFILDRTLTPAIRSFGFREVRMIDPTCGSGHFLLGGFARLVDEWQRNEPARNPRDIAQKALDAVAGVDLNPFAVAISRFRLLVAALSEAPDFRMHVAIGDSLLHGRRFGLAGQSAVRSEQLFDERQAHADEGLEHAYAREDLAQVQQILGRQYHAVVGNPPYIVVKDAALNAAYRKRYASCHMKYSLGCPFTERFFELAVTGERFGQAGFVGLITTNSFMKREFGAKLIEDVLPRLDLTHVIDTSGAYIPGHGTPTVILLGCHRPPHDERGSEQNAVRAVMGIKGEPNKPDDAAQGLVWRAIVDQIDDAGSESKFVSVVDTPRRTLSKHPWSIGGGGAADLKDQIEEGARQRLGQLAQEMGVFGMTNADESMLAPASAFRRQSVEGEFKRPLIVGDLVRDWSVATTDDVLFPYAAGETASLACMPGLAKWLWSTRTVLGNRATFGKSTYFGEGRPWWGWHQVALRRLEAPLTITFGEVATHNHFVLDRGGKVFNRTAPVIKLPAGSNEDDHLGVLGLLNSSVACFWFQQVCHNKGGPGGGSSKDEKWHDFYAFNSTKIAEFPLAQRKPIELAAHIDRLSSARARCLPRALANELPMSRSEIDSRRSQAEQALAQMIGMQEELDWVCYGLYGLLDSEGATALVCESPPEIRLGERAFEIVMARAIEAGALETKWFEWLHVAPVTEVPHRWPAEYKAVVERRIALIESSRNIGLVETPGCKRRWEVPRWDDLEQTALGDWLLDRLEVPAFWPASADTPPQLTTTNRLADLARTDAAFMQVAALYAGHADFDPARLVAELVAAEAVPLLPVQRYTDDGLRKRAQWESTWVLQRREDAIDAQLVADNVDEWRSEFAAIARTTFGSDTTDEARAWIEQKLAAEIKRHQDERKAAEVGPIPVPPKYKSTDFLKADFWRLRGGLDVPKERFVSFPGAERGADGSLPIAWAGWNHLQLATALAGYYVDMKDTEGWEPCWPACWNWCPGWSSGTTTWTQCSASAWAPTTRASSPRRLARWASRWMTCGHGSRRWWRPSVGARKPPPVTMPEYKNATPTGAAYGRLQVADCRELRGLPAATAMEAARIAERDHRRERHRQDSFAETALCNGARRRGLQQEEGRARAERTVGVAG